MQPVGGGGLVGDASAVTSIVSVSSSAGTIWLGRLKVNFSLPVLAFQLDDDSFAAKVFASTSAIAVASLSLLSWSPSRHSAAANRIVRSMSDDPRGPAGGDHAGHGFELRDQRGGAIRIDADG